ncbi:MAG: hypothetical protein NTW08_01390 [Gammaproteobacteria bacterium]|nr:hypothetical protein [Gammaproteobacteria bacterium]
MQELSRAKLTGKGQLGDGDFLDIVAPLEKTAKGVFAQPIFSDFKMCVVAPYTPDKSGQMRLGQNTPSADAPQAAAQNREDDEYDFSDDRTATIDIERDAKLNHPKQSMYKYNPNTNTLIILHSPVRKGAPNLKDRIDITVHSVYDALKQTPTGVKVIHIIPEIDDGQIAKLTSNRFGGKHIFMRIQEEEDGQVLSDALIDPRQVAQGRFNDTDCGRYVVMMVAQAIGLLKHGRPVTVDNLKASNLVMQAEQFKNRASLTFAASNAYVSPRALPINKIKSLAMEYRALEMIDATERGFFKSRSAFHEKRLIADKIVAMGVEFKLENLDEHEIEVISKGRLKDLVKEHLYALTEKQGRPQAKLHIGRMDK